MRKKANEEIVKSRQQNRIYQSAIYEMEKRLQQAQFIELGYEKSFNRCNLKFTQHQMMLVDQRKLIKTKLKVNEVNQRKIRLYNRILDICDEILLENKTNFDKICKEIGMIWKQYQATCKQYKLNIEENLRQDVISGLNLMKENLSKNK